MVKITEKSTHNPQYYLIDMFNQKVKIGNRKSPEYNSEKGFSSMAAKLSTLVKEIPALQKLAHALRRLQNIQSFYSCIIPQELQHSTQVGFIEEECLVVFAFHGSAAANLRQRAPSLLKQLQEFDPAIEKLKIQIQVQPAAFNNDASKISRTIPENGIKSFQLLADKLPDSPLKDAVKQLLKE